MISSPARFVDASVTRRTAIKTSGAEALLNIELRPGVLRSAETTSPTVRFTFWVIIATNYANSECGAWSSHVVKLMKIETHKFCLHRVDLAG